jgi:hypothetical protein
MENEKVKKWKQEDIINLIKTRNSVEWNEKFIQCEEKQNKLEFFGVN